MDYAEEKQQEIEILQSIYPDEFKFINGAADHFKIKLVLETESENRHSLLLTVKYPETYPDVEPVLEVSLPEADDEDYEYEEESEEEVSSDDDMDETKHVIIAETIFFDDADLVFLNDKLIEEASYNVGMPAVFALTSTLKDEAERLFQEKLDAANQRYDDELMEREREEQKKFLGTKVTVESFNTWKAKFNAEMKLEEVEQQRLQALHKGRMTGKEIFERGLGGDED
ncbi:hypothetical protein BABINDRAFT_48373, partial [Babjeviella inositovora NRRL Y-12698]